MLRDYETIRNWLDGLSDKDRETATEKLRQGTLTYDLTLEQALQFQVRIKGKPRTLEWVLQNHPKRLELFMDTMEPGSVLYYAITLVYNANLDRVLLDVEKERRRIRELGIEGLAAYKAGPMKIRPVNGKSHPRVRVMLREGPGRRVFLHPEVLAPQGVRRRIRLRIRLNQGV